MVRSLAVGSTMKNPSPAGPAEIEPATRPCSRGCGARGEQTGSRRPEARRPCGLSPMVRLPFRARGGRRPKKTREKLVFFVFSRKSKQPAVGKESYQFHHPDAGRLRRPSGPRWVRRKPAGIGGANRAGARRGHVMRVPVRSFGPSLANH